MEPLVLTFEVPCPPARAFALWAGETTSWWPASHSVSGDPSLTVTFEPHEGGRVYERLPDGTEHDWGSIVTWDPPTRLAYRWHLRQDAADATLVTITFTPSGTGTAVTITHAGWEALGANATTLRDRNRQGWSSLLPHYLVLATSSSPSTTD
jgi:uncharacterized protein YndB with AHSA1/START domain